jgi:hypothetical protein
VYGPLVGVLSVVGVAACLPAQAVCLGLGQYPGMPGPGDEVVVVLQGLVVCRRPRLAPPGVDVVQGKVAANQRHPWDVVRCFHQRAV